MEIVGTSEKIQKVLGVFQEMEKQTVDLTANNLCGALCGGGGGEGDEGDVC